MKHFAMNAFKKVKDKLALMIGARVGQFSALKSLYDGIRNPEQSKEKLDSILTSHEDDLTPYQRGIKRGYFRTL